jgi:uncharacterized cupin superfamily protein
MAESSGPIAVVAIQAPLRTRPSIYPEPFASRMSGRAKQPLGDLFGLTNFGVNLTRLKPSEFRHCGTHSKQDEFIYILEGTPTLVTDEGERRSNRWQVSVCNQGCVVAIDSVVQGAA